MEGVTTDYAFAELDSVALEGLWPGGGSVGTISYNDRLFFVPPSRGYIGHRSLGTERIDTISAAHDVFKGIGHMASGEFNMPYGNVMGGVSQARFLLANDDKNALHPVMNGLEVTVTDVHERAAHSRAQELDRAVNNLDGLEPWAVVEVFDDQDRRNNSYFIAPVTGVEVQIDNEVRVNNKRPTIIPQAHFYPVVEDLEGGRHVLDNNPLRLATSGLVVANTIDES